MIPFACAQQMGRFGDQDSFRAAKMSIVSAVDLGAISGVPGDGECNQCVIRSGW